MGSLGGVVTPIYTPARGTDKLMGIIIAEAKRYFHPYSLNIPGASAPVAPAAVPTPLSSL